MKSIDALALLVDSAAHAGFLQKEKTEMGDSFPLATIVMKDGTMFNVQVWHLQKGESSPPAEDDDTTEVVTKTVKLRVRRNKK